VICDEARERFDEQRMAIQRRRPVVAGNSGSPRGIGKQHIHFVQRLDMIGDERERDHQHVAYAFLAEFAEDLVGAGSNPLHRPGARLEREELSIREIEPLEHAEPRGVDVLDVRIAFVDESLRQPVGAEKQHCPCAARFRDAVPRIAHCRGERIEVERIVGVVLNVGDLKTCIFPVRARKHTLEFIPGRPGRCFGPMGKQRQRDDSCDPRCGNRLECVVSRRPGVAHRDEHAISRIGARKIQTILERTRLLARNSQLRRTASDPPVIVPHGGTAHLSDHPGNPWLQRRAAWKLNNLPVGKEIDEKRLNRLEIIRSAKVEQEDGSWSGHGLFIR